MTAEHELGKRGGFKEIFITDWTIALQGSFSALVIRILIAIDASPATLTMYVIFWLSLSTYAAASAMKYCFVWIIIPQVANLTIVVSDHPMTCDALAARSLGSGAKEAEHALDGKSVYMVRLALVVAKPTWIPAPTALGSDLAVNSIVRASHVFFAVFGGVKGGYSVFGRDVQVGHWRVGEGG